MTLIRTMVRPRVALLSLVFFACANPVRAADVVVLKSSDASAWQATLAALRATLGDTVREYSLAGDPAEAERVLRGLQDSSAILVAMGPLAAETGRRLAPTRPMCSAWCPTRRDCSPVATRPASPSRSPP